MRITRTFTTDGKSPYDGIGFRTACSEIRNPDGSVVFRADDIEVPSAWSQVAVDVLAQKYFRKAGIPARLRPVEDQSVPEWLRRQEADEAALAALPADRRYGGETSAKQVFDRLAGTWTWWGWKGGYFDGESDARAFFDELRFMLARQYAAPNSPQWFNTGLHWAYGIDGPAQGHYFADHHSGEVRPSTSAYERPQPHACFIQSIADDLVNPGGIMDLWVREARLFKYGSGTGTNFSRLRGENEPLSGGGKSSGLMSFLKIGDRAAGAIKSGGTTRRAAKMVVVDVDHPDIEEFVDWKVVEEQKVAALVAGSKLLARHLNAIMTACHAAGLDGEARFDPKANPELKRAVRAARQALLPESALQQAILYARQGYTRIDIPTYSTDWDSDAYLTVSGQNSNNSVRVTNEFLERVVEDREWLLRRRTDGAGGEDRPGARLVEQDHPCRLGQRRSRRAVRHHDQRVAHLPELRPDQRLQSVLGVHVPRRHRVQSRLAQPDRVPARGRQLRRRRLRPRGAPVDRRARDLGHDGPVPLGAHRRAVVSLPHARARLRQPRRPADGLGHRVRQPQRRARSPARSPR